MVCLPCSNIPYTDGSKRGAMRVSVVALPAMYEERGDFYETGYLASTLDRGFVCLSA
jgi:hypothetical protein